MPEFVAKYQTVDSIGIVIIAVVYDNGEVEVSSPMNDETARLLPTKHSAFFPDRLAGKLPGALQWTKIA